ncbi:thioredoxin family protein [Flavihumibacter rivuli]|uniref:thioredoxin family protein n=1 Tax=Flavihumibacter rivuli TaxID=2838156 RepID=UPI001EFA39A8|nr:thioredoxin family protein [Flavihumibacter rivuli]ULQ55693.1 thioredoxin family protein [Flavihumibacter rivuli]
MERINIEALQNVYDYPGYRQLVDQLMQEGKTTGTNQEPWLVDYARLNIQRMSRWEKTWEPAEKIRLSMESIAEPMTWLTITEGWCGDAAQIVPIIDKLSKLNPHIEHKLVLRDENLELMDQFLTNGTRSIPKTMFIARDSGKVLGTWGPRPTSAAALVLEMKKNTNLVKEDLYNAIHGWYARDKGVEISEQVVEAALKASQWVKA